MNASTRTCSFYKPYNATTTTSTTTSRAVSASTTENVDDNAGVGSKRDIGSGNERAHAWAHESDNMMDDGSHSPVGKRARLEEAEPRSTSVEELLTKQFSDSTRHKNDAEHNHSPSSARRTSLKGHTTTSSSPGPGTLSSTASYLRAAAGAPAEGPGLRGIDNEVPHTSKDGVSTQTDGPPPSLGAEIATTVSAYPPNAKTICIRHQSMADEGKTAKLQKVSTGLGVCPYRPPPPPPPVATCMLALHCVSPVALESIAIAVLGFCQRRLSMALALPEQIFHTV